MVFSRAEKIMREMVVILLIISGVVLFLIIGSELVIE